MLKEKRVVDFNAYITDLTYEIINNEGIKSVKINFRNLNYGIITAIRFELKAYDSFEDEIIFSSGDAFEIKKADLNIKPCEKASFTAEIGNYDIKKISLELKQIVFADSGVVLPKQSDTEEYEIDILRAIDREDADALAVMRENNQRSICYPAAIEKGWICSCGYLNSFDQVRCRSCNSEKAVIFEKLSKENVETVLRQRAEEKAERERIEKERRKAELEKAAKKKKLTTISVTAAIIVVIIAAIIGKLSYNNKYGLSKEDRIQYDIAQGNYTKIDFFVMGLSNDYYSVAYSYYDGYGTGNKMSEAEKDRNYLYSRGIYEASSLLYELIEEQYPEKYRSIYKQIINLKKGDVFNDVKIDENLYVKGERVSDELDKRDEIDEAIDKMEAYLRKTILNPSKVKSIHVDVPSADYSKVYGISLGILFYEDGSIKYIGEFSNGKADGIGEAWYSKEDGGGTFAEGTFSNGYFSSGEHHYGTDGNTNDISEAQKVIFEGEFTPVKGLTNSRSSESVAAQTKADEENNQKKAQNECESYVNLLLKKQKSINKITWTKTPTVSGSYYYFSCTVIGDGYTRQGTITVRKQSDGSFAAQGLEYD